MGEKMSSPPLIEALCEFRFKPSGHWDWTLPGRFYDQISEEFSDRSQENGWAVELKAGPGDIQYSQINAAPERIKMIRPDNSAMVQVGVELLAINQLRPYPDWDSFRTLILKMYETYTSLYNIAGLERIGLRYINQISLKDLKDLSDFITPTPILKNSLDRPLANFYQRYELRQDSPQGILIFQTGNHEKECVVIDLDFFSTDVDHLSTKPSLILWLDAAHERIYESFVDSLHPNLYKKFKNGGL